ncbi:MAG TPA: hypothetical protein VJ831_06610 [Jatrophihabitantaceae bacterium]|nr:hypothetical protein [Jatrophihabitantaceae bacterium]
MTERTLDAIGLVVVCVSALLAALMEMVLVPVYAGSVAVPVAAAMAIAGNTVFPRLAFAFVSSGLAAAAPCVIWGLVVFFFGLSSRPEGDVILPGGGDGWFKVTLYAGVLVGGVVAAVLSAVFVATPRPVQRPPAPPRSPQAQ